LSTPARSDERVFRGGMGGLLKPYLVTRAALRRLAIGAQVTNLPHTLEAGRGNGGNRADGGAEGAEFFQRLLGGGGGEALDGVFDYCDRLAGG